MKYQKEDSIDQKYMEWVGLNDLLPLFRNYDKLSRFVKTIHKYTEMEDKQSYRILRSEINELSDKVDEVIKDVSIFENKNKDYKLYKEMFINEENKEG
tara:strand:+ start:2123 stop:2416 length:294 start_codon:yes stop_codon:yes gene_type:complete